MVETIEAIFSAIGESPGVLLLADELDGLLLQRKAMGDRSPADGNKVVTNSVSVKLALAEDDSDSALEDAQNWLDKYASILKSVDCRKTIEFQIYLDSNTGSMTLTLPCAIVRSCGELGLDVAIQAIRILTRTELAEIRSRSN